LRGVDDTARAYDFHVPLCAKPGWRLGRREADGGCGWMRADIDRPLFFFDRPLDGRAPEPANGVTIAFDVPTYRRADTPTHRHTDTPTHRHPRTSPAIPHSRCRPAAHANGRRASTRTSPRMTTARISAIHTATTGARSAIAPRDAQLSGLYRLLTE
jgi:hypothetical protein